MTGRDPRLRLQVSDLLARPGTTRREELQVPVEVDLGDARVSGEVDADVTLTSLTDGVMLRGVSTAVADLACSRCLTRWSETSTASFEQIYRLEPLSEDELPIDQGGWIDIGEVIHDEVALALPRGPVCRPDCKGLCPTCGTDLNVDPCGGHGEDEDSPFAPLRDLFEP